MEEKLKFTHINSKKKQINYTAETPKRFSSLSNHWFHFFFIYSAIFLITKRPMKA
jgi:hypothetical protein